jgi:hypothetical protein
LVGCKNKGQNLPFEEAKYRLVKPTIPEKPLISPPAPAAFPETLVTVAGGLWQAGFNRYQLPTQSIQPVGSASGMTFYALTWDSAPYDRLLVVEPGQLGKYREFLAVY